MCSEKKLSMFFHQRSLISERTVIFFLLSLYNASISISQPENRRLSTMYCIHYIPHVPKIFLIVNIQNHESWDCDAMYVTLVTKLKICLCIVWLLSKEISTLGYYCISRKTFALQATRAMGLVLSLIHI